MRKMLKKTFSIKTVIARSIARSAEYSDETIYYSVFKYKAYPCWQRLNMLTKIWIKTINLQ